MSVAARLAVVRDRIRVAAAAAGRSADEVRLVVVSKGRSPEGIAEVYGAGHREFGESRAQELGSKTLVLPADIRWHFVGPLQTNKVRSVRPAVAMLHSMDRLELGRAWLKGVGLPPPVTVEVNIGREPAKVGAAVDEVGRLVDELVALGVPVVGLMAVPPRGATPEDSRPWFARLRSLRDDIAVDHPGVVELSMGMSDDFEAAIAEGATIVRLGRAIFGS